MRFLFAIAATALLVGVYCSRSSSTQMLRPSECVVDTVWRTAEPIAARVSRLVPAYAGGHATPESLTVFLTDTAATESVRAALHAELGDWGGRVLPDARFVTVRYSFRHLQSWLECVQAHVKPGEVGISGLRYNENQIWLLVADSAHQRLEQLLKDLAIPRGAVQLERGVLPSR